MTNCPQCGELSEQLHEGYCEQCCNDNQAALDRHNAEISDLEAKLNLFRLSDERQQKEIEAKGAEIERLKEEHANCPPHTGIGDRGWMEECKRAEQKLEALNAFVAADDDFTDTLKLFLAGEIGIWTLRAELQIKIEARAALEEK